MATAKKTTARSVRGVAKAPAKPAATRAQADRALYRAAIRQRLETMLGISVRVKLVEPKSIERTAGKAKRVIDRRTLV